MYVQTHYKNIFSGLSNMARPGTPYQNYPLPNPPPQYPGRRNDPLARRLNFNDDEGGGRAFQAPRTPNRRAGAVPNAAVPENPLPNNRQYALFSQNAPNNLPANELPNFAAVSRQQFNENIHQQAERFLEGRQARLEPMYIPPPLSQTVNVEDPEEFWDNIAEKLPDGQKPVYAVITCYSYVNSRNPNSAKSKLYNGKIKCYPQLPAEFQYDFEETVSKTGKVNIGTVGYSTKKNKMPGGTEVYAYQDADNIRPKTFYFYLTDLDNVPQEDNQERMYKPFYDIQEEYYNKVDQNTHLCQLDFQIDPTIELGKKLTSAFRKEIRKLADANYHINKNTNYDLRNNLRIATGSGVPNAKLQWNPFAKTFYVPDSQYDLQRSFNESVATNQEVERVDSRAARAANTLGLVPNYRNVDTSSDLSSTPASSSVYALSLGEDISPITPIRTPRNMRGPNRIPSESPSPRIHRIYRSRQNDSVNGGISGDELAQVRTSLEEVQQNIRNLADQVRVMKANSPKGAAVADRQPPRRRVMLRSPYELRRQLARYDPNTFRGNRNDENDGETASNTSKEKMEYLCTFFPTFFAMYGPSVSECHMTRTLLIEKKTFEDISISLWTGVKEGNMIWDIVLDKEVDF